jgi:biotin carboxylase
MSLSWPVNCLPEYFDFRNWQGMLCSSKHCKAVSTSFSCICGANMLVSPDLFFLRARGLRSADPLWVQGHAFEARVYAENPAKGFMPSPGTIASWRVPPGSVVFTHAGEVRVDSGVQQGDQVGL